MSSNNIDKGCEVPNSQLSQSIATPRSEQVSQALSRSTASNPLIAEMIAEEHRIMLTENPVKELPINRVAELPEIVSHQHQRVQFHPRLFSGHVLCCNKTCTRPLTPLNDSRELDPQTANSANYWAHIVLSCAVFWFCGYIFGFIALIMAVLAQIKVQDSPEYARHLGQVSLAVSVGGIVVIVIVVAVLGSVYRDKS